MENIIENYKSQMKMVNTQMLQGLRLIEAIEPIYNEQWKQINGHANFYISNCGRVKNIVTEMIMKQSINSRGYKTITLRSNIKNKTYKIHRLVAGAFIDNANNYKCVDHKNNNRLDNLVSNLRHCTNQQNCMNVSKRKNTSSMYKGVTFNKANKKWVSQIRCNNKQFHLGYFVSGDEAGRAYNEKAIELFGEFACLNVF